VNLQRWLSELAEEMNGEYDEEGNLCVDSGDGFVTSYAAGELRQFYSSRIAPREAADVLRMGGMP